MDEYTPNSADYTAPRDFPLDEDQNPLTQNCCCKCQDTLEFTENEVAISGPAGECPKCGCCDTPTE